MRTVVVLEQRALLRKAIDVRARQKPIAVAAQVIGQQRIDANEQDIRVLLCGGHTMLLLPCVPMIHGRDWLGRARAAGQPL